MIPGFRTFLLTNLVLAVLLSQDCNENEVELWNNCYSIENTDSLNLTSMNMNGEIPTEIGDLINLVYLNLSANNFSGSIPVEIGNLVNLNYLYLQNNQISGDIPSTIGNLTNLIGLKLYSNNLSGVIPAEIGNLIGLEYLSMSSNALTGAIPPEMGNLQNLTKLYMFNNNLTGAIPSEFGELINLQHIYLNGNNLSGSLPAGITNLDELTRLYLYDNQITGEFPCDLCDIDMSWDNPSSVKVYQNQFCPPYPECIQNNIGEQDTSICESLPITQYEIWDKCYMVEYTDSINLGNTGISGPIPSSIGYLTNLKYLYLHDNNLSGPIPPEICNLEQLTHLYLYENNLSGELPIEIGNLNGLKYLLLYNNNLSGQIPPEIGDLENLEQLFIYGNQLTGVVPAEIENLSNLQYLYLNDNELNGALEENLCDLNLSWESPIYFNIYNNSLCEPYPSCIQNFVGYQDTSSCDGLRSFDNQTKNKKVVFNVTPNPFNSTIDINFMGFEDKMVNVYVYDMLGKLIANIYSGYNDEDIINIHWSGKNLNGNQVGSGIYFLTFIAEDYISTKKITLLE